MLRKSGLLPRLFSKWGIKPTKKLDCYICAVEKFNWPRMIHICISPAKRLPVPNIRSTLIFIIKISKQERKHQFIRFLISSLCFLLIEFYTLEWVFAGLFKVCIAIVFNSIHTCSKFCSSKSAERRTQNVFQPNYAFQYHMRDKLTRKIMQTVKGKKRKFPICLSMSVHRVVGLARIHTMKDEHNRKFIFHGHPHAKIPDPRICAALNSSLVFGKIRI